MLKVQIDSTFACLEAENWAGVGLLVRTKSKVLAELVRTDKCEQEKGTKGDAKIKEDSVGSGWFGLFRKCL